mmetsp:Transcript_14580/g.33920  ORF Transcript_14580/g.33920 Transcript_14580/m.33920 type:complete len:226 (-) Transcript_14580:163-840(-)
MQLQREILNPQLFARIPVQPQSPLEQNPGALDAPVGSKKLVRGGLYPDARLAGKDLEGFGVDATQPRPALGGPTELRVLEVQGEIASKLADRPDEEQMDVLDDVNVPDGIVLLLVRSLRFEVSVFVEIVVGVLPLDDALFALGLAVVPFAPRRPEGPQLFEEHLRFDVPDEVGLSGSPPTQQVLRFPSTTHDGSDLFLRKYLTVHQIPQRGDHLVEGVLDLFRHR